MGFLDRCPACGADLEPLPNEGDAMGVRVKCPEHGEIYLEAYAPSGSSGGRREREE